MMNLDVSVFCVVCDKIEVHPEEQGNVSDESSSRWGDRNHGGGHI